MAKVDLDGSLTNTEELAARTIVRSMRITACVINSIAVRLLALALAGIGAWPVLTRLIS